MAINVPYISDEELKRIGERFIAKFHRSRTLPVPIEEIVEFDFKIDIIPVAGFREFFEVDGFISTDLKEIRVDHAIYDYPNKNRYRFTLAHELSHVLLHSAVFEQLKFKNVSEWKQTRDAIPEKEYRRLEFQANFVAGVILVPAPELANKFHDALKEAEKAGIDIFNAPSEAWDGIENWLGKCFGVSSHVINRRARSDGHYS